jgi:hypothetical protein
MAMTVCTPIGIMLPLRSSQPNHLGLEQFVEHSQPNAD